MAEVIQFKIFKPGRLDEKWVRLELLNALRKEGRYIRSLYQKTVATWTDKPEFEMIISLAKSEPSVIIGTNDKRFLWTDEGTKKYIIHPKPSNRRGLLFFEKGYAAKTTPGQIVSSPGGRFGPVVSRRSVPHQTRARNFTKIIQKQTKPRFHKNIIAAMKRGADRTQAEMAKGQS